MNNITQKDEIYDFVCKQPLYDILHFIKKEINLNDPRLNPIETIQNAVKDRIENISPFLLNEYYNKIMKPTTNETIIPETVKQLNKLINEYGTAVKTDTDEMIWALHISTYDIANVINRLKNILKTNIFPDGGYNITMYETGFSINLTEILNTIDNPDVKHPMLLSPKPEA